MIKLYIYITNKLNSTAVKNYTYDDSSWGDLLTSYNGDTITYDAIGNPLQYRNGISFIWENGRQLQSYTQGNTNVSYTYDSNGMRLSKDVNGVKRNYLYNNGLLMQEIVDNTRILDYSYDSAGNPVSVAYRTSLSATPIYYYYAVNSRGDVVGIYTASGSLLVVYEYDAWGNILSVKNANGVNIANQPPTNIQEHKNPDAANVGILSGIQQAEEVYVSGLSANLFIFR